MKKINRFSGEQSFLIYSGLDALLNKEETTPDALKAARRFVRILGRTDADIGLTLEPDAGYKARQEMGVRAERKGKNIIVTIEGNKP